ncbi:MAG: L,D-transpeptidase family protein [Deltaproteobacteria bacterium]|nr:L,D-transpeptidase family protein [Deltaproteobacteria bacterium]
MPIRTARINGLVAVTRTAAWRSLDPVAGFVSTTRRAIALLALLLSGGGRAGEADATSHCPRKGDVVAVISEKRQVWLCRDGAPQAHFQVALGAGGVGKRRKGDGRTPVGTYALGSPRPSKRFGTFIPIAYPTPRQAARGLTGGAVGIHGPPRGRAEPEYPASEIDWTEGCVATGTDEVIEVIADFVRQRRPVLLVR